MLSSMAATGVQRRKAPKALDIRDRGTGFTSPRGTTEEAVGFPLVQGLSRHFGISRNGDTHAWAEVDVGVI